MSEKEIATIINYLAEQSVLLTQQNEILKSIYVAILFVIGIVSAVFVLFLLYKFICLFF